MIKLDSLPGRIAMVNGKAYTFFSGYAYLGIAHVESFRKLIIDGVERYGNLYPSSRNSNTRLSLYDEFEDSLSSLTGNQATASFSSGYLAAHTVSKIFLNNESFIAPHTHPALCNGLIPYAGNFQEWSAKTLDIINSRMPERITIGSDSVNIMESLVNDFSFLSGIHESIKCTVIIDDSHGIGIIGNGKGICASLPKKSNIEYIITYSLSKAIGILGGAISGPKAIIDLIRQQTAYAGSTAINPSMAYAFLHAQELYQTQLQKLQENIKLIEAGLKNSQINHGKGLPIFILPGHITEELCLQQNIIISSFAYPLINSSHVNRVIINALHTTDDLDNLITAINEDL